MSQRPEANPLDELRKVRQFHFDQFYDYRNRAANLQKRAAGRIFQTDSRDAFERAANDYEFKANQHLRFVRALNAFFPEEDRVQ
jgi:hypothetical protein